MCKSVGFLFLSLLKFSCDCLYKERLRPEEHSSSHLSLDQIVWVLVVLVCWGGFCLFVWGVFCEKFSACTQKKLWKFLGSGSTLLDSCLQAWECKESLTVFISRKTLLATIVTTVLFSLTARANMTMALTPGHRAVCLHSHVPVASCH